VSFLRPCVIVLRSFLQSSIVFGRSSKRVAFLRGVGGLSHERVHGGKDLGNKWDCWAHSTRVTMLQPDHKLRGSLCRSLEKATLISSPSTIILIEFSTKSNAKRGTHHHHHHHQSSLSRTLEVLALSHIARRAFCISLLHRGPTPTHPLLSSRVSFLVCLLILLLSRKLLCS